MNKINKSRLRVTLGVIISMLFLGAGVKALWITGYYPEYEQGVLPAADIDFTTVTHVIHFCLEAEPNGTINSSDNGLTPSVCGSFVNTVHNAGRKALICVGGAGSEAGFEGATTNSHLAAFVSNLAGFMSSNKYDGVDIDWEPLADADVQPYTNFVRALRLAINAISPNKLLTVAAPAYAEAAMFASIQTNFDQINIMTYDLSGPYEGWVTWYNSPLFDGGYRFASTEGLVPSVGGAVTNFEAAGITPARLGIGLPFYGYIWTGGSGVNQPRESWTVAPSVTTPTYETIMNSYYQTNLYHWDNIAQAAYLSITNPTPSNDMFISYDDAHACQTKVSYARNGGLGGIMIWELSQDYASGAQPLLEALHESLATPQILSATITNGNFTLTFSSLPIAAYRILWTTNLLSPVWNTLTNNVPGTGAALQITDPAGLGSTVRYYRVQTPP